MATGHLPFLPRAIVVITDRGARVSTGVGRRNDSPVLGDVPTVVSPNGLTP